ncbi:MAG: YkoF family thiamine/hydroxymethylpyrimidine-binding protein [Longimicrobiales bacterium]|nr:YkoF family thiamine/hydroxymethylpyrimidine-binding protein [Longimicrobiales bacterium]
MRVACDISLYPLSDDFLPPIRDVIERLNAHDAIEVVTNPMSTQLRGEFGDVMRALETEIGTTFERLPKAVFAIRILNNPHGD